MKAQVTGDQHKIKKNKKKKLCFFHFNVLREYIHLLKKQKTTFFHKEKGNRRRGIIETREEKNKSSTFTSSNTLLLVLKICSHKQKHFLMETHLAQLVPLESHYKSPPCQERLKPRCRKCRLHGNHSGSFNRSNSTRKLCSGTTYRNPSSAPLTC